MFRQGSDGALPPAVGGNPPADVLAERPVEVDQRRVDGGKGAHPGGIDEPKDLVDVGLRRRNRRGSPGPALRSTFLRGLAHAVSSKPASVSGRAAVLNHSIGQDIDRLRR
jgi:hypothetical protein